jgi:hypothetical protein
MIPTSHLNTCTLSFIVKRFVETFFARLKTNIHLKSLVSSRGSMTNIVVVFFFLNVLKCQSQTFAECYSTIALIIIFYTFFSFKIFLKSVFSNCNAIPLAFSFIITIYVTSSFGPTHSFYNHMARTFFSIICINSSYFYSLHCPHKSHGQSMFSVSILSSSFISKYRLQRVDK